jgi:hypothetical protein
MKAGSAKVHDFLGVMWQTGIFAEFALGVGGVELNAEPVVGAD